MTGGKVSCTSRFTSLLPSSVFNSLDKVLSELPFTSFAIWLNLLGPDDKENKISSFHLPSSASSASLTDNFIAWGRYKKARLPERNA